ncbi:MAG TPA: AAA family ATPase [Xanthobacteraceae bacterium]|nr:AAA family ATPase [Xanthobacteraceae bacterium]
MNEVMPEHVPPKLAESMESWARSLDAAQPAVVRDVLRNAAADLYRSNRVGLFNSLPQIGDFLQRHAEINGLDDDETQRILADGRTRSDPPAPKPAPARNGHAAALPIDLNEPTPEPDAYGVQPPDAIKPTRNALVAFPLVAFKDICLDLKRSTYLVKRLLPRAGVAVIWGPPKCYKSFWAMDLALHIALGWTYRGRRVQQAAVVYLCLEGKDGLPARKEAMARHYGVGDAPFHAITTKLNLAKDAAGLIASVEAQLQGIKPGAVFIDTLNRSLVGSESKDEDMQAYLAGAATISEKFNSLVAIVHHCGYDASRMRGHSSLPGAIDAQIRVDRTADLQMTATVIEAKDFPEGEEIASRLESVELGVDPDGDPVTSLVVLPPDETMLRQVKRTSTKGLGAEQKNALTALTECLAEAGVAPSLAMGLPASVNKVVTLEQWKEQLFRRGVLERGEGKNWASKWSRLKNKLSERGHIGIMDERVWRT